MKRRTSIQKSSRAIVSFHWLCICVLLGRGQAQSGSGSSSGSSTHPEWYNNWDTPGVRTLSSVGQRDPRDRSTFHRGRGKITVGRGGATFKQSPRLFIEAIDKTAIRSGSSSSSSSTRPGAWENVLFTGYARMVNATGANDVTGFTMGARSNHDNFQNDGCAAFGYYARIYYATGECALQKEYFHGQQRTYYSASMRAPCFGGGRQFPMNQWIGMRFQVETVPGTSNVSLALLIDREANGTWTTGIDYIDSPGRWPVASSTETVPSGCGKHPQNGDTVLRPGRNCFLRSDGDSVHTEVHWRNARIVNSRPYCANGIVNNDGMHCCAKGCGTCGGANCGSLPGGSKQCCRSQMKEFCRDRQDVACRIPGAHTYNTTPLKA